MKIVEEKWHDDVNLIEKSSSTVCTARRYELFTTSKEGTKAQPIKKVISEMDTLGYDMTLIPEPLTSTITDLMDY